MLFEKIFPAFRMNKLRFQRVGRKHKPYYRFVSISSTKPQSSLGQSVFGLYQPLHGASMSVNMHLTLKYIKLGSRFTSNSMRLLTKHLNYKTTSP